MASEWNLRSSSEITVSSGDFNGRVGKREEYFEGVHGGMILGKEMQKEDCWNFVMKKSCAWQTLWFYKADQRKITYSAGGCETEIDFLLVEEKYRKYVRNVLSDLMGTSAQAGSRTSEEKFLKKIVRKQRTIRKRFGS